MLLGEGGARAGDDLGTGVDSGRRCSREGGTLPPEMLPGRGGSPPGAAPQELRAQYRLPWDPAAG